MTLLRQLLHLRDYTLVVVESIDFADDGFEYEVRPLRGVGSARTTARVLSPHRFKQGHLCIADIGLVPQHDLHPLVRWEECPRCDAKEVFFYESAGDERVHYVSFDHGHALSDSEVLDDFQRIGLL